MNPYLVAYIINTAANLGLRYLTPKPPDPRPLTFDVPDSREGEAIPIACGSVLIESPRLAWWKLVEVNGDKRPTGGWRYYADLHMVVCHGPIEDEASPFMVFNGKPFSTAETDFTDFRRLTVDAGELFGGIEQGGGVVGDFDLYRGSLTQAASAKLEAATGVSDLPGYQGVAYVVATAAYLGTQNVLPSIAVSAARFPNALGVTGNKHKIDTTESNPICWIYEILTNMRWGLKKPTTAIDTAAFIDAAEVIYDEGIGISMVVDRPIPGDDLIQDILRYVDGVVFKDPATGLITIKLARLDYDVATLPHFTKSNARDPVLSIPNVSRTNNEVRLKVSLRVGSIYVERVISTQNQANIEERGGRVSPIEVEMMAIRREAIGEKVAARMLNAVSYAPRNLTIKLNREGWDIRPGSVFKLTLPALKMTEKVWRVLRVRTGTLLDGWISVDAVEDIFGILWTAQSTLAEGGLVPPADPPQALAAQRLLEAPYPLGDGVRRVLAFGVRVTLNTIFGYQVWSDPLGGTAYSQTRDVNNTTPSGTLVGAMTRTSSSFSVEEAVNPSGIATVSASEFAAGKFLALIDDEIIAITTATYDPVDDEYDLTGIARGVIDTTPAAHSAGARVYFFSADGSGFGRTAEAPYGADLTLTAKLLPWNSEGVLAIGSATQATVTTLNRAARPYLPAAIKLNTVLYPATISGALVVSWSHRNRLGIWTYDNSGAVGALESGTTYTLELYGDGAGSPQKTYTGLTGTSQEWTTEAADMGGSLATTVRVKLWAVRDGLDSHQVYDFTVTR